MTDGLGRMHGTTSSSNERTAPPHGLLPSSGEDRPTELPSNGWQRRAYRWFADLHTVPATALLTGMAIALTEAAANIFHYFLFDGDPATTSGFDYSAAELSAIAFLTSTVVSLPISVFCVGTIKNVERSKRDLKTTRGAVLEREARLSAQFRSIPIPTYSWRMVGDDLVLDDYNDAAIEG